MGKRQEYSRRLSMTGRMTVAGMPGALGGAKELRWFSVSRHGLSQQGIICPGCGTLAARTLQFHLIHATPVGEAVHCFGCTSVLLASPDDDVDPVAPGQRYDESVYHTFARAPELVGALGQRVSNEQVQVEDWVVIVDRSSPLFGSEGRVVGDVGEDVNVALSGNHGLGGAGSAPGTGIGGDFRVFKRSQVAVMILPTLRRGDPVRILRGPDAGKTGVAAEVTHDRIKVLVDGSSATVQTIPERVEKVVEHERFV
jgi:hypothetical protein